MSKASRLAPRMNSVSSEEKVVSCDGNSCEVQVVSHKEEVASSGEGKGMMMATPYASKSSPSKLAWFVIIFFILTVYFWIVLYTFGNSWNWLKSNGEMSLGRIFGFASLFAFLLIVLIGGIMLLVGMGRRRM